MKTSNIIVVSLIASITLIISTGALEFRIKGVRRGSIPRKLVEMKQVSIPEFHYMVVRNGRDVSLDTSDVFKIEMADQPDSVVKPSYYVKNDTLYVNGYPNSNNGVYLSVKAPAHQVKWIHAVNSRVIVYNPPVDQFFIRSDNSNISIHALRVINSLTVDGVNYSKLDFPQSRTINTLNLNLDHSEIFTSGSIGKVKGTIRNESGANLRDVGEMAFTRDETSKLQVWK